MVRYPLLCFLALLLVLPAGLHAQRWKLQRYEASLAIDATLPFMDVGSSDNGVLAFCPKGTRPGATLGLNYRIMEHLTAGLDLGYLRFGACENGAGRLQVDRFVTSSFEHLVRADYTILGRDRRYRSASIFNRRGMVNDFGTSNLYAFAGLGGILSKARLYDIAGVEIPLRDPSDTNESNPFYNNMEYGFVLAAGIGYKLTLDDHFIIGAEIGGRYTFTDKLDGYQTIYSNYDDRYFDFRIKGTYKINNDRRGRPVFGKYSVR